MDDNYEVALASISFSMDIKINIGQIIIQNFTQSNKIVYNNSSDMHSVKVSKNLFDTIWRRRKKTTHRRTSSSNKSMNIELHTERQAIEIENSTAPVVKTEITNFTAAYQTENPEIKHNQIKQL